MGDLIDDLKNKIKSFKDAKKVDRNEESSSEFVINREMLENFKKSN